MVHLHSRSLRNFLKVPEVPARVLKIENCAAMIRENWQLIASEPVEFEEEPVEGQDYRKIPNHFRGIYRMYPNLLKGKPEDV